MSQFIHEINQWLVDFTLQVRNAADQVVGTAFAVQFSPACVVTCAHVVREALGRHARDAKDQLISLYYPEEKNEQRARCAARVIGCFSEHQDDVVLLEVVEGFFAVPHDRIAVLGNADDSDGNQFRSYGFRRLAKYQAGPAHGTIEGHIRATDGEYHAKVLVLESNHINSGMSGAAVLDMEKNLVVGIVSQAWFTDQSGKDQDTAFGVNAKVLSLAPLHLPLYADDLPYPRQKLSAPQQAVPLGIRPATQHDISRAPQDLADEWVGRAAMLVELERLVAQPTTRVISLVGLGGEGKTSLARRWLLRHRENHPTQLAFWWSFYEERSSERFFESLVQFLTGSTFQGSVVGQVQICAGVLHDRPYTLVLDGFEVIQYSDQECIGRISSESLREFLQFCARSTSQTQVVITTREDLTDLLPFTTYQALDVTRLLPDDGMTLLRETGVQGTDQELKSIVEQWEGHALTLALLGKYLGERFGGDLAYLGEVPPPTSGEPFYERVTRVLRRYDEYMSEEEKTFLLLFSAFRLPVQESAFPQVFRTATKKATLNVTLRTLDDTQFDMLIRTLITRRLLRSTQTEGKTAYTIHPLIRSHYISSLIKRSDTAATHHSIAEYYRSGAGNMALKPSMADLEPYIEIVYHLCSAGAYDEAYNVHRDSIRQGNRHIISQFLGAYETELALVAAFFSGDDLSGSPIVSQPSHQHFLLSEAGLCLMQLGHLAKADHFYNQALQGYVKKKEWRHASIGWQNFADLCLQRGDLKGSFNAAENAFQLAAGGEDSIGHRQEKSSSLAYRAWTLHLMGKAANARVDFARAEQLERWLTPNKHFLYGISGTHHAEYLWRNGDIDHARHIAETNAVTCSRHSWKDDLSQCQRVLGDLAADIGDQAQAHQQYDKALQLARSLQRRDVLIEALIAQGRWYARHGKDAAAAFHNLNEAMIYILQSGYRLYEADARVALAWMHHLKGDNEAAQQEVRGALKLSANMGYYWGRRDAKDVLARL